VQQRQPEATVRLDVKEHSTDLRMQEYVALLDYTARLSDRRQNINNFFAGINAIFLTAFGYLFVTLPLVPWWPVFIFPILTAATGVINLYGWRRLNLRYRNLLNIRFKYLAALEEYFQRAGEDVLSVEIEHKKGGPETFTTLGIHRLEEKSEQFKDGIGFSTIERHLIWIFFIAYVVLAGFAVGVTIANALGYHLPAIISK
jgi:hypothetical protein